MEPGLPAEAVPERVEVEGAVAGEPAAAEWAATGQEPDRAATVFALSADRR